MTNLSLAGALEWRLAASPRLLRVAAGRRGRHKSRKSGPLDCCSSELLVSRGSSIGRARVRPARPASVQAALVPIMRTGRPDFTQRVRSSLKSHHIWPKLPLSVRGHSALLHCCTGAMGERIRTAKCVCNFHCFCTALRPRSLGSPPHQRQPASGDKCATLNAHNKPHTLSTTRTCPKGPAPIIADPCLWRQWSLSSHLISSHLPRPSSAAYRMREQCLLCPRAGRVRLCPLLPLPLPLPLPLLLPLRPTRR